ncbi:M24 family metallopeptidase [Hippea maritima]|uniref:Peptidase M24 n=1 Tax=Hippea maritima (strain ATCC 700847 / DSM 10411 / MH2) TaxID=760142 RepID=F2LWC4_HIPMA|nr:Xaa-Pro peptidase family protein [Hippea maritima]AEA34058.1 peptidase M24 [Hippea maritima DSM 10411]
MKEEFSKRISDFSKTLKQNGIDVALIMQNTDLYYFSGTVPSGALAISDSNDVVYAIRRGFLRAEKETAIPTDSLFQIKGLSQLPKLLHDRGIKINRVGVEMDVVPADMFLKLKDIFKDSEIVDISFHIRWQRAKKSPYEIEKMQEAARMLDCTMEDAKELIRAGKREIEVSAELEFRARKRGHQGRSRMRGFNGEVFMGHVHSGYRSAYPSGFLKPTAGIGPHPSYPEGASFEKIEENSPVIVDFLANYQGYLSDETRLFVVGSLPKELEKAYYFCKDMLTWLEEVVKPGMAAEDVYNQCLSMAKKAGYEDNFMGIKGNQTPFVGHGIGLELDEFPFIAKGQKYALEENMTFAFEPKVAFDGVGAVGIENVYLLTKEGAKPFNRYPRDIIYL